MISMIHIGRRVPKGFEELGGVHLGGGVWMFRIRPEGRSMLNKCIDADERLRKLHRATFGKR